MPLQRGDPLPLVKKGGQNEGTVVNHLRMVNYKLALSVTNVLAAVHHIGGHLLP